MTEEKDNNPKGERIAKLLARAGVGSRRAVERMIEAGMVKQHGKVITTPATLITSTEGITVDGMKVKAPEPARLWIYHKPPGRVTSYHDPEGRPTIFEALPAHMPRVISVGRLDLNTEGLILLTNDGELSRWMELPDTGWLRTYKVRAHGRPSKRKVEEIREGVTIDGVVYREVELDLGEQEKSNLWLTVGIREGKNREVRKLLEYAGLQVTRLIRLSYGPFELGKLERGAVVEVERDALHQLCRPFFEARGIKVAEPEAPKPRAKPKAGWAKPKAKPAGKANPRRERKQRLGKADDKPERSKGRSDSRNSDRRGGGRAASRSTSTRSPRRS
ncbi:pseudouridine synthase [Emcibacter nanhaiensis]|uniref:Pseudouridine synthase n=1 Tax=Emcibacter nanhaiensis TaxID=1505037 RepID=A0A501PN93_9PROT|nr:pseudouridine synthase [Emcibacter nanhaiensis]TPD61903.1 rRNA pseudouridine synthase [Emcibacter nanhaiensis]